MKQVKNVHHQQGAGGSPAGRNTGRGSPAGAYASARAAKLDQQTPKWPELRVRISDEHSTISASGITHDLTADDPQSEAVTFAAAQARTNGQPIRMTATMATGDVHRMIITPDRTVILLDHAHPGGVTPTLSPAAAGNRNTKTKSKKNASGPPKSAGILNRFPPRLQPVIKWGAPAFALLLVILVGAAILKGPKQPAAAATIASQDHPVPAGGALYTVTAPPGWSQTATWTVALADHSAPYTDPGTGVTAALTPDNRTTAQTAHDTAPNIAAHQANYLSVLSPDGSTRFTAPLSATPVYGPVITTVDGTKVVLLQESSTALTYWPITGGPATTVTMPDTLSGPLNTTGPSVMAQLSNQKVAYLHHGAFQILEALPLTTPMFADDGSIISVQPETGAWWTQRIDASPTSIKPAPPAGAAGIDQILAITPQYAIISWKTAAAAGSYSNPDVVAVYDVATGKRIAQASSINTLTPAATVYYSRQSHLTAAAGFVLSTPAGQPAKLTLIDGLQVFAVYDQVYGQDHNQPAVINAAGGAHQLPASALTPVGDSTDHLMVASQDQLYALPADPGRSDAALPTITTAAVAGVPAATAPPTTSVPVAPKSPVKVAPPAATPAKVVPRTTTTAVPKSTSKVVPKTTGQPVKPIAQSTTSKTTAPPATTAPLKSTAAPIVPTTASSKKP